MGYFQVSLKLGRTKIYTDEGYYQKRGAWRLVESSGRTEQHQYESNDKFSRVTFTVKLNVSIRQLSKMNAISK